MDSTLSCGPLIASSAAYWAIEQVLDIEETEMKNDICQIFNFQNRTIFKQYFWTKMKSCGKKAEERNVIKNMCGSRIVIEKLPVPPERRT